MCVCVYVHVYVYMFVCMRVCVYVCVYVCNFMCVSNSQVKYMRLVPLLVTYFPSDFSPQDYTYERFVWAARYAPLQVSPRGSPPTPPLYPPPLYLMPFRPSRHPTHFCCAANRSIILSRSWGRGVEEDMENKRINATASMWGENAGHGNSSSNKTVKNVHTLAPAADMPNHSNEGHQALKAPDGSLVLRAGVDVPEGEQVSPQITFKFRARQARASLLRDGAVENGSELVSIRFHPIRCRIVAECPLPRPLPPPLTVHSPFVSVGRVARL